MNQSDSDLDMRNKLPLHVRREKKRGKTVFYYREGQNAKRIRLPDFGTPEFMPAYRAAVQGQEATQHSRLTPRSLKWCMNQYMGSRHFLDLSDSAQRNRSRIFKAMVAASNNPQISKIKKRDIVLAVERRASVGMGTSANTFLKAVRPLFAYCLKMEWIAQDPTAGVARIPIKSKGYHAWTIDEVKQFVARHPRGTMAHLAIALLLFTGLRRGNVYDLGRQHVQGGMIDFTPSKTADSSGVRIKFPILASLQDALDLVPPDRLTFLVTSRGVPFKSGSSFGNWFRDRCVEAGVPGRAHGLRKAGATIAANNGATAHELMAVFGWTKLSTAEMYTRAADRAKLGTSGIAKIKITI